jgi:hypothetical protein
MPRTRLTVAFLFCAIVLHPPAVAHAQDVKTTFDKSVDFSKYKKYSWGSNYLLTAQPKDVQDQINMAIVDSINRNLRARGFVEDDAHPDFRVTYSAGGHPQGDLGAQRSLYASDMVGYYWGDLSGISSDAWVTSLATVDIAVTDAASKKILWQATASKRISEPRKFVNNLHDNVDKFIQKTMKGFPPKK